MNAIQSVWKIIWKTLAVGAAIIVGAMAANQVGWSAGDAIICPTIGFFDDFVTHFYYILAAGIVVGTIFLIKRLAKWALWIAGPIFLYSALVLGLWNGYLSDFDTT